MNISPNKPNVYKNPFELGTNEYAQSMGSGVVNPSSSPSGGFPTPNENFSFITPPTAQEIIFPEQNFQKFETKNPLAFGQDGQSFLTFVRPPEWFIKEQSIKILESASINSPEVKDETKVEYISVTKQLQVDFQSLSEASYEKEKEAKDRNVLDSLEKVLTKPFALINKTTQVVRAGFGVMSEFFSFVFSDIFGFGEKKPQTEEEIKEAEKEAKRNENKKIFWSKLAELSRPVPIAGALKEEMIVTNQLNSFNDKYEGTVYKRGGRIYEYHKANRIKKEEENKAHQIQQARVAKLQTTAKKAAGPFTPRAGELLMGAENPSHFTKALG